MSDVRHPPPPPGAPTGDHSELPHEGPIKTPKQLILAVFFSFVVPIFTIVMLATFVTTDPRPAAGSDALLADATARRIHPVGVVEVKDLLDPAAMKTGEQVYAAQCSACHASGVAGAPKFGDAAAWGSRVGQGYQTLLTHALKGKGAMGPQGGGDFSDYEIGRAVVFMANKGGATFAEPAFVAAGDTAADPAVAPTTPALSTAAAALPVAGTTTAAAAATATAAPALPGVQPTPASAAKVADAGGAPPALYAQVCSTCHAAAVAGAPKTGDKASWAPRLAQGVDGLTASAIKGKGAMPPKGGSTASDADIKAVVSYMVAAVK